MPTTLREAFEGRLTEFEEADRREQDEAIRTLAVTGELLELLFDEAHARLGMTALRVIISHGNRPDWDWSVPAKADVGPNWREVWARLDGYNDSSCPAFFDELYDLNAFAYFGIVTTWGSAGLERLEEPVGARAVRDRLRALKDVPAWVESVCVKIDRLERLALRNEKGSTNLSDILWTRDTARARIKFDQGQPITVRDLAALSGVSIKRVQNAVYAKTDEAPVVDKSGLISPDACEPWLAARDYRPSIWKQVAALYPLKEGWGDDVIFEQIEPDAIVEDYVFVPVAYDGTMFIPALRREGRTHEGGYTIGAKGAERNVGDYHAALEALGKMETPRWRRPNPESGNWGIVTGQSWRRVRLSDIEGVAT